MIVGLKAAARKAQKMKPVKDFLRNLFSVSSPYELYKCFPDLKLYVIQVIDWASITSVPHLIVICICLVRIRNVWDGVLVYIYSRWSFGVGAESHHGSHKAGDANDQNKGAMVFVFEVYFHGMMFVFRVFFFSLAKETIPLKKNAPLSGGLFDGKVWVLHHFTGRSILR
jgi:hypothetical protein